MLLAFYGYFINIFGPITPFLKAELSLSYTVSGLHYTAFALGMLLVGLGGHLVIERLGRRRSVWLGVFGLSLGALLLLLGRAPALTVGASFLMGLVGSLILSIVPSAIADHHGAHSPAAMSEANTTASLVSAVAPLLVGWFAATVLGWRFALALAAAAALLFAGLFRQVEFPPAAAQPGGRAAPLSPTVWLYLAAQFFGVAVEFCMIYWSADYLQTGLGLSQTAAAQSVSLFLSAMILGRLFGSRLVQHFSAHQVLLSSVALAGLGFLTFWLAPAPAIGLAGLFLTGLGVANLYPLIVALALRAAAGNTVQAGARATLASGAAILALPLVLGRLADSLGIRPAYGLVGLLLLGVLALILLARRSAISTSAS